MALYQATWVKERLEENHPDLQVSLVKIKTTGDKIQDAPLAKIGGKGLFVKEIEEALLAGQIDLAVHSIKDLPTELPEGLHLAAITQREDPRDAFISKEGVPLKDLPSGAKVGTSSLRRQAQLLHFRPDLRLIPLRGNLDTRLRKLKTADLDGLVVASAGLKRLGLLESVTEILSTDVSLPAIGQGALGIETRRGDLKVEDRIGFLNDREAFLSVTAERALLRRLEGGCQVPIAAYGRIAGADLLLEGLVGTVDGRRLLRHHLKGPPDQAEALGIQLAEMLLNQGAGEILSEIYRTSRI